VSKLQNLYVGRSGQLAVMAEFLIRGYNTATPEVDRGDDIFVVEEGGGKLSRIQVKAANARDGQNGVYQAQFKLKFEQLRKPVRPDTFYVFAMRREGRWEDFVVLGRKQLFKLHQTFRLGLPLDEGRNLLFTFKLSPGDIRCGEQSLQPYRNDWSHWPPIAH
jgi:hypothetical protein